MSTLKQRQARRPLIHVMPVNDLQPHDETVECACRPIVREHGKLVVHNSYDGRELIERHGVN